MSIEQLDLLLCDTYQMDAWFPFGWKWKKELEKSSYSVWAIDLRSTARISIPRLQSL